MENLHYSIEIDFMEIFKMFQLVMNQTLQLVYMINGKTLIIYGLINILNMNFSRLSVVVQYCSSTN